ncbi:MAG: COX15/CtaA family protein [Deltaproteobacteria bacterium]|nr:COX15/CtaA family protein [Deltaproteobacteria bacterium]MBI3388945.1 COX15/CtaA family protein [Deltaproteobacteria bacterium]
MGLSRYAKLAWITLAFNVLVILWGAFVRASGSGAGCGSHWPLCNGEVVPRSPAIATLIEFGHRLSSGVALVLIAALVIGAWRGFPRRHPVRLGAALSGFFIVSEALIGAGLVLLEYVAHNASLARGFWVAGHLMNTFLLVGSLTLTAWWASGGGAVRLRAQGGVLVMLTIALLGTLVLGVSGAVTALGDTLFPAASLAEAEAQTFSSTAHLFVRLRVWHPALAIAVGLCVLFATLTVTTARRTAISAMLARGLVWLYLAQIVVGVLNVSLLAPIAVQIFHLLVSDLIWIVLVLFAASALAAESPVHSGTVL